MTGRLPWRYSWGTGNDFVHREDYDYARIIFDQWAPREAKWQWHVKIDGHPKALCAGGDAMSKQEAADLATEAWWRLRAERASRPAPAAAHTPPPASDP